MAEETCPPLGTGSVDMNALHDAAHRGADLDKAIEAATTRVEPLTEEEFAELPSLTGKTRKQLAKIATDEGAQIDVNDEALRNQDFIDAIEAKRNSTPVVDADGALLNPPLTPDGDATATADSAE